MKKWVIKLKKHTNLYFDGLQGFYSLDMVTEKGYYETKELAQLAIKFYHLCECEPEQINKGE